jgi:hypothetical protein
MVVSGKEGREVENVVAFYIGGVDGHVTVPPCIATMTSVMPSLVAFDLE